MSEARYRQPTLTTAAKSKSTTPLLIWRSVSAAITGIELGARLPADSTRPSSIFATARLPLAVQVYQCHRMVHAPDSMTS